VIADKSSRQKGRIAEVDGLRGLAILLVVSFHYINNQLVNSTAGAGKLLAKLTGFGWVGVDLFFVLSGFLIGNIVLRHAGSKGFFKSFYIRRLLRIVPNYYLLLVVYAALISIPFFKGSSFITGDNVIPLWSYFAMIHNFFMANLNSLGNSSISITWSIGIEEQFYLTFPFLLSIVNRKYINHVLIALIIISLAAKAQFSDWIPPYVLPYCRMDALCFGVLVANLFQRHDFEGIVNRNYKILLVVLSVVVVFCGLLYYKLGDLGIFKQTLFSIVFCILLLIALVRKSTWFASVLRIPVLRWIGMISYSLYLFHYLILGMFHLIFSEKGDLGIFDLRDVIVTLGAFFTSVLISWLIYRLLELPLVTYGKRYKYSK
jgi:peptidoglycan/LPS O-acetylase OafA/YrhL